MYPLSTKRSIGTITLTWANGQIETYLLGQGRLSLTPYENLLLLNFWVVSEYEIIAPDNSVHLATGPMLEILSRVDLTAAGLTFIALTTPNRNEASDDWDIL